jgi:hypothetical protein
MRRDGYTGFKFYQVIAPQDIVDGGQTLGEPVNTKGYETVTMVVNVGANTSAGAFSVDNRLFAKLEHAHESAAGLPSTWSEVYPSQMIHSVIGECGAYSTLLSGIFMSIDSVAGYASAAYAVGYKGPRQYVRVVISGVGLPSVYSLAVLAILGLPANWPVNIPV